MSKYRQFWIKARGHQDGIPVDISSGDNRWIETTVQQVSPVSNSAAIKMGPFVHVIEMAAYGAEQIFSEKLQSELKQKELELESVKKERDRFKLDFSNNYKWRIEQGQKIDALCFDISILKRHESDLCVRVVKQSEAIKLMRDALEFYRGEDTSDIELDIFDHFKCDHKGNSEFDSKWLCKPAREALSKVDALLGKGNE